mgnify:CR=1 FL=1
MKGLSHPTRAAHNLLSSARKTYNKKEKLWLMQSPKYINRKIQKPHSVFKQNWATKNLIKLLTLVKNLRFLNKGLDSSGRELLKRQRHTEKT